eukprot:Em0597g5a
MRRESSGDRRIQESMWLSAQTYACLSGGKGSGDLPEFHFGRYLMGRVYNNSVPCGVWRTQRAGQAVRGQVQALRKKLVPEALGVPDDYHCPFPATIALLNAIDTLPSPLEKLYCIQDAMATILSSVLLHISQALHTTIQYFYWPASDSDRLGYVLVTFIAAMEYIRGPEVQSFLPPPQSQAQPPAQSGGFASGRLSSEASSEQPRKIVPMTESVSKTSHSSDLGPFLSQLLENDTVTSQDFIGRKTSN